MPISTDRWLLNAVVDRSHRRSRSLFITASEGVYMTSVKQFRIEEPATPDALGRGAFQFTDDYSVFDWGKMPDEIPRKGASLCIMGAFNFEHLEDAGVATHYRGVVTDGETVDLASAVEAGYTPRGMSIELTQVPDLPFVDGTYDYDAYHDAAGRNYLIPLEIVFRNTVPVGSSLRSRTDPRDHGLDFGEWPAEAVDLRDPIVEFSTKYEEGDRYLDRVEADRIAGAADLDDLEAIAREVNRLLTERASEVGLAHQDGKIECLYHGGEIRVADVVGTFDENRFSYAGQQVSKEVLRQYYKREHPAWVRAVASAKERAKAESIEDWHDLCDHEPPSLPDPVIGAASDLYAAGANAYTDMAVFDAPALKGAVEAVRGL
jgi:phosphoribosylaminoimidazole-succinocarboxamide synthase